LPPVRTALAIFMSFSLFMVASDGVLLAQEKKARHREGEKCSRRETRVTGPVSVVEPGPDNSGPSSSCNHCNPVSNRF
jgi:hypothetical protein